MRLFELRQSLHKCQNLVLLCHVERSCAEISVLTQAHEQGKFGTYMICIVNSVHKAVSKQFFERV